jgi:hypothetical protein
MQTRLRVRRLLDDVVGFVAAVVSISECREFISESTTHFVPEFSADDVDGEVGLSRSAALSAHRGMMGMESRVVGDLEAERVKEICELWTDIYQLLATAKVGFARRTLRRIELSRVPAIDRLD